MSWLVVKTFLMLGFIFALMVGVLFVVRKYFYSKPQFASTDLKVLTSVHLQPKKTIFLVKVFNKVMLVGVSDSSIASLGEITDPETLNKLETGESSHRGKVFSEILKGLSLR